MQINCLIVRLDNFYQLFPRSINDDKSFRSVQYTADLTFAMKLLLLFIIFVTSCRSYDALNFPHCFERIENVVGELVVQTVHNQTIFNIHTLQIQFKNRLWAFRLRRRAEKRYLCLNGMDSSFSFLCYCSKFGETYINYPKLCCVSGKCMCKLSCT